MATAIRMKRGGRTHAPYYRIVVIDSRARSRGPEVDLIGTYHPCARPEDVSTVDAHKALEWLGKGAVPSDTTRTLFRKMGIMKHFHEGTQPEEKIAVYKGAKWVDKGHVAPGTKPKKKPGEGEESAE